MGALLLSKCCNFSVVMVGNSDSDEGSNTFHYECNNCLNTCEVYEKIV